MTRIRLRRPGVAFAILVLSAPALSAQDPVGAQLQTRLESVEGISIRVTTSGLDGRDPRSPVVVFEAGAGSRIETWAPILEMVAGFAPVVAYDRSGIGRSEWDGLAPTPGRVVGRLRQLLRHLDVAPPYVLVGHSWGAALIHHYAMRSPADVGGIVYLDPTDFTWSPEDELALLESVGMDSVYYEQRRSRRNERITALPQPARSEQVAITRVQDEWRRTRAGAGHPSVQTSVVMAAQRPVPESTNVPFDAEAYADRKFAERVERLTSWVRNGGSFTIAPTTEHYVHRAEPELVVDVIRQTVRAGG